LHPRSGLGVPSETSRAADAPSSDLGVHGVLDIYGVFNGFNTLSIM
jgi:hypothetical protein